MKERRPKVWLVVLASVVVLLICAAAGFWLVVMAPLRSRYAAQTRDLERSVAAFHGQRWERPVLRGEGIDDNAFDAQREALAAMAAPPEEPFSDFGTWLRSGEPASPELLAFVQQERAHLDVYRASTQNQWSWGDYAVEAGFAGDSMEFIPHLRATRALILIASRAEPAECLEILTDVIRLGQDRSAGRSLVGAMIHHVSVDEVFRVMPRCLRGADADPLARAALELEILVRHPLPIGFALEIESLGAASTFAESLRPLDALPTDSDTFEVWWTAGDYLEAWDVMTNDAATLRTIGNDYPDDIDAFEARQRRIATHGNPILAMAMGSFERYLRRDASTRTRLVMLWAQARLLAGEPRAILEEEASQDPLTGAPLETREADDGLELRSAGEDGTWGPIPDEDRPDDLVLRVDRDEVEAEAADAVTEEAPAE